MGYVIPRELGVGSGFKYFPFETTEFESNLHYVKERYLKTLLRHETRDKGVVREFKYFLFDVIIWVNLGHLLF